MIKRLHILFLLLAVLVLPSGCIKEDYDDCSNVAICFQYLADGKTNVLNDYITKVDLYVFDEGNHIIGVSHYGEDELKRGATVSSFRLVPGKKYKMVAIGNAFERTELENLTSETDFNKIYLKHPAWKSDNGIVDGHDHNYLGQIEFQVPGEDNFTVYRDTVTFQSAHVNVDIEINGLPAPMTLGKGGEIPYELRIEESNARTNLNGKIKAEDKEICVPALIYDQERNCYRTNELSLFRMSDPSGRLDDTYCKHQLVLLDRETGKELVRGSIYDYANDHKDKINLTKQEATLPIAIVFDQVDVEIKLPQWWVEDITPDWNK